MLALASGAMGQPRPEAERWPSIAVLQDLAVLGFLPRMSDDGNPVGYRPCFESRPRPASNYQIAVYCHVATLAWQAHAKSKQSDPAARARIDAARDRLEWLWEAYAFELRQMGARPPKSELSRERRMLRSQRG